MSDDSDKAKEHVELKENPASSTAPISDGTEQPADFPDGQAYQGNAESLARAWCAFSETEAGVTQAVSSVAKAQAEVTNNIADTIAAAQNTTMSLATGKNQGQPEAHGETEVEPQKDGSKGRRALHQQAAEQKAQQRVFQAWHSSEERVGPREACDADEEMCARADGIHPVTLQAVKDKQKWCDTAHKAPRHDSDNNSSCPPGSSQTASNSNSSSSSGGETRQCESGLPPRMLGSHEQRQRLHEHEMEVRRQKEQPSKGAHALCRFSSESSSSSSSPEDSEGSPSSTVRSSAASHGDVTEDVADSNSSSRTNQQGATGTSRQVGKQIENQDNSDQDGALTKREKKAKKMLKHPRKCMRSCSKEKGKVGMSKGPSMLKAGKHGPEACDKSALRTKNPVQRQ